MKANQLHRCPGCGRALYSRMTVVQRMETWVAPLPCSAHPLDEPVEWRTGKGIAAAFWYLVQQREGRISAEAVDADTFDPVLAPGVTAADLALARIYFDRWGGYPEQRQYEDTAPATAMGLYGKKVVTA